MKLLDVTIKDLIQSSRSYMVYIFAFVIPILVTGLFMVMFGGIGGDDENFALPSTTVVIVNLDEGQMPAGSNFAALGLDNPQGAETDIGAAESFGDVLSMILESEVFADFMIVSDEADENAARAAVDNQEAGVAVIIPANFTSAMIQPDETADVLFYQDPTLLLGPAIVESIVRQLVDSFSAGTIAIGVTIEGLLESGIAPDQALIGDLVDQVTSAQSGGQAGEEGGQPPELLEIQLPPGTKSSGNIVTEIVGVILGGMMVFFVFYTAAAAVQTILTEEERGTLARLFTTPTSHGSILGGKTLAGVITVIIQMTILMLFGALLFSIFWGEPPTVFLAVAGIILVSSATGLFLTSLMQNTRQGGFIFGGVLTVTGMLGLVPVFTAGVPNQPESLQIVSLLVPQGWAMRGLTISMDGGTVVDILPIFAGLMVWTLVLGFIGQRRLQKRFA